MCRQSDRNDPKEAQKERRVRRTKKFHVGQLLERGWVVTEVTGSWHVHREN